MTIRVLLADDQAMVRGGLRLILEDQLDIGVAAEAAASRSTQPLSHRETEVVRAIARGRTNQEIAAELFISLSTVKSHLAASQAKLGARNRVQIAAWAWEHRLADPT